MNNELLAPSVIDYFNKWNFEVKEIEEFESGKVMIATQYLDHKVNFVYFPETGKLMYFRIASGTFAEANYYHNYLPKNIELLFKAAGKKVVNQVPYTVVNDDKHLVFIKVDGEELSNYDYDLDSQVLKQRKRRFDYVDVSDGHFIKTETMRVK